MTNFLRVFSLLAVFTFLLSCSGRITGQLNQDGSGSLQISAGLEPNMIALIRSVGAMSGGQAAPLLDAAAINRSLQAMPGVATAALRNTGQEKIEGTVGVSRIGDLLNAGADRFARYEAPAGATPGRLAFRLERSSAPRLLAQLAPGAVDYLSALMAPAATGEALSKEAYLALVESIYGKPLALEIASSRVTAAITMPNTVKSVKGGTSSGREARFDIPLTDLLVLERPLDYEITW